MNKVRIDKWLWAARFFKTRSLAKAAIEGGKVHMDGQRIKASKEITVGSTLQIRQGWDIKTVEIIALSDQRRGAPEANTLYRETAESIAKRETEAAQRKALRGGDAAPLKRPTKKQRRQIHGFWEKQ
ncbi:S4 domain-containing protein [Porticoccus sp. W117]|uniref:RNA-binding S4 domain-containing protein n=1 Tax=Porticoccus sp. W117 TaxID=3054777 RepID=UPI0025940DAA|nr:S4 domain-containing protein [Porticoccus sp. W117]MDM3870927.1 S4 domain-containing protein [Porticoccus sp. W117]